MGKVRTRTLGLEDVEKKQKQEQKKRAQDKGKSKIKLPGKHKGGEKTVVIQTDEESLKKMEKAKELIEKKPEAVKAQEPKKKVKKTKARPRGKKYQLAKKQIDKTKKLVLDEALTLLKKVAFAKFDESVELHLNLEKPGLRGEISLPHQTGKSVRVRIVDDKAIDDIEAGKIDFDILITNSSYMPRLASLAKILGPKGLMPNPKTGTISDKPEEVAKKFQGNVIRYKTEAKAPLIHQMVGKISLGEKALEENIKTYIKAVGKNIIKQAFVKTTMSPAVQLDLEKI